ncbi:tRNA adenosine(34) deaminase TadA [soil metagenome]
MTDAHYMQLALQEAAQAAAEDEVPIGCVIVHTALGVIAASHNQKEQLTDPTAHAEMIALTQAAKAMNSWRLTDCTLYVTLEPCPMCAGGIVQARVPRVVYGCPDPKAGACHTLFEITNDVRLNHRCEVVGSVLAAESAAMLSSFFVAKRALGKK